MRRPDVDVLMQEVDSELFARWKAFESVDPGGETREDLNTARLMWLLAMVNRDPKGTTPSLSTFIKATNAWHTKEELREPPMPSATVLSVFRGRKGVTIRYPDGRVEKQ